ncbi:DCL family protein [Acidovorax sp. CCYZU-2555]|uniref:DCL family protein n=1 Tax=Acidovorax sp. CCYZU-2555 TaxID=2835042 RepID=UPI001BD0C63F|nr:DCL family protein [Acidovorax sp. CCYZU-2555]MBS7778511.1 DCL family protein [Acidovorax sp. CCYZU-2555]
MAKSVTLEKCERHWNTQSLARDHFVQMLHRYARGQTVAHGSDHNELLALLEIYDTDRTKRGCGVASFFLDADRDHPGNTNCFYILRTDGSSEDFSVHKAVKHVSQLQNP